MSGPPHWQVFYDSRDRFPESAPVPAPPTSLPLRTTFLQRVDSAVAQTMTASEALEALQRALERMSFRWYA